MFLALLAQASLLARPLYLEDEPPELRSLRELVILDATSAEPGGSGLAPDAALELATRLRARAVAGEDFEQLARTYSNRPSARSGGVLGSFAPGVLPAALERFLFEAEVGAISEPLAVPGGVCLAQRIDTRAAVLQILIEGTDEGSEQRTLALLDELRGGADFGALARERSADRASAERGGQYAIFERGPRDALLKEAAFRARVGEIVGPIRTAYGFHVLKRVGLDEVDPALGEQTFVRLRTVLIAHRGAVGAQPELERTPSEAQKLAEELHQRILGGEDMAALAAELDDDPGGRERRGDLGWIHRNHPDLPRFLDRAFLLAPGELVPPVRCTAGFVLLRRER